MFLRAIRVALAAITVTALVSCGHPATIRRSTGAGAGAAPSVPPSVTASPRSTPSTDPARVHANELGQIPVLMIHQIQRRPTGDYAQTPAQLRATLEYLADHHYVPITAAQLVTDRIDVPAGASPVVLTFDDGYPNQFVLRADGSVDPNCAVGIVLAVAREHPGFRPVGTVYVNRDPFGVDHPTRQLAWLVKHGWEIGNHTRTHANLGTLAAGAVRRELATEQQAIGRNLPGYDVTTMALPFGVMPSDARLARTGTWQGTTYHYHGVMLVGANPAPSPFTTAWDPFAIPRIRSWHGRTPFDEHYWLPKLTATRYVSDGNPQVISFPRAAARRLAARFADRANPY